MVRIYTTPPPERMEDLLTHIDDTPALRRDLLRYIMNRKALRDVDLHLFLMEVGEHLTN